MLSLQTLFGNTNVFSHIEIISDSLCILKEINDDVSTLERKWADDNTPFLETRRTPDLENMDLETYQQSIAQ